MGDRSLRGLAAGGEVGEPGGRRDRLEHAVRLDAAPGDQGVEHVEAVDLGARVVPSGGGSGQGGRVHPAAPNWLSGSCGSSRPTRLLTAASRSGGRALIQACSTAQSSTGLAWAGGASPSWR